MLGGTKSEPKRYLLRSFRSSVRAPLMSLTTGVVMLGSHNGRAGRAHQPRSASQAHVNSLNDCIGIYACTRVDRHVSRIADAGCDSFQEREHLLRVGVIHDEAARAWYEHLRTRLANEVRASTEYWAAELSARPTLQIGNMLLSINRRNGNSLVLYAVNSIPRR